MYGYGHFGPGFGGLGMILLWIVPVVLLILLFRRSSGDKDTTRGKTALEILKERYARGEIDREEFEERKRHLSA